MCPPPIPHPEALILSVTALGDKVSVHKLGRESLLGTESAGTVTLDILDSRIVRNRFLLFKATWLVVFCHGPKWTKTGKIYLNYLARMYL